MSLLTVQKMLLKKYENKINTYVDHLFQHCVNLIFISFLF